MNPTSFSPRPFAGEGPRVRGLSLNYAKLSSLKPDEFLCALASLREDLCQVFNLECLFCNLF